MIDFACKEFDMHEIIKCGFGFTRAELSVFLTLVKDTMTSCSTEDIARKTKLNLTTIQKAMKKMYDQGLLVRRQKNLSKGGYVYTYSLKSKPEIRARIKDIIRNWSRKVEAHIDSW